ncbi:putative cytokinin riboside 5'-monophosphate phosphoribohydrolase LOGL3 [Capsicum annuum]|nr:putative cytokinin riboside 5'-monophosphate phosphoribohydrolase LOGL3 [Capsicum annuum]KAF3662188.1 putative cytokinin riboside 5'-monophosphate phosphoribohydrolase LOGL3 [Capsicum annuum]
MLSMKRKSYQFLLLCRWVRSVDEYLCALNSNSLIRREKVLKFARSLTFKLLVNLKMSLPREFDAMVSKFKRIYVFCGSSQGKKSSYQDAAIELGKELISRNIDLVYGEGGYGILEELLEVITWAQLGIHDKTVELLNVNGYYNSLLSFIEKAVEEGFINLNALQVIVSAPTTTELIEKLEEYVSFHERVASKLNWETEQQLGYPQAHSVRVVHEFMDVFSTDLSDDILVYSKYEVEHKEHLRIVLQRLSDEKLYAKFSKSNFWLESISFLDHVVTKEGIIVHPSKIATVHDWDRPTSPIDIQSFVVLTRYYQCFVEGFASIIDSLTKLTQKKFLFNGITALQLVGLMFLRLDLEVRICFMSLIQDRLRVAQSRQKCYADRKLHARDFVWVIMFSSEFHP